MNERNATTSDFEFVEEGDSMGVFDVTTSEDFDAESEEEIIDKSEVIIYTIDYHLRGKISLVPGARLTDYIVESHQFIAVTDVEVFDRQGNLLLKTPFLDINRDHIVVILPAELATVNGMDSR